MDRLAPNQNIKTFKFLPAYSRFIAENCFEEFSIILQGKPNSGNNSASIHTPDYYLNPTSKDFSSLLTDEYILQLFCEASHINETPESSESDSSESRSLVNFFIHAPKIKEGFLLLLPRYSIDEQLIESLKFELDEFFIASYRHCAEKLVQKERDFYEIQDFAQIGSFLWDIKADKLECSIQASRILGMNQNEKFDSVLEKIHPSDKKDFLDAMNHARQDAGIFENEYRCQINNEEKVLWLTGKFIFQNDAAVQMKAVVMDVTEKIHTLKNLQRSEELYKQAQQLNQLGNWTWDMKNDHLSWSDELYRIYGLEPQSVPVNFEKFVQFIHPEDRQLRIEELQEQIAKASHKDYHFRILAADGKVKILHGQSEVLCDEEAKPYKIVGTCQDVTAQKELENDLLLKTIQLQKSNDSLQEFAYVCSHDLKEPLRKISIMGDRLKQLNDQVLDVSSKRLLDKMIGGAEKLQHMIDDILSISAINAVKIFEPVNLNELIDDVLFNLEDRLTENKATVWVDDLPELNVNPGQFRQLFTNLLLNSLKFRKPDLPPKISISSAPATSEELASLKLPEIPHYRISIKDNGIGFNGEYAEKIFSMFQRLHDKDHIEGTGIGLSICKKIADHHNGQIVASGETGVGAEFILYLPQRSA